MAKSRRSKGRRSTAAAENAKTPQLQAAGPSEDRVGMLQAFSSIGRALPEIIIKVLSAIKILIEVLKSLNIPV